MRIIGKECRKILDLRVLAVLVAFTFVYYQVFMEDAYSVNGRWMKYVYAMMAELAEEVGTTLSRDELPVLDKKRQELAEKADARIAGNTVLADLNVGNLGELESAWEEINEKQMQGEGLTEEEQRLASEIMALRNGGGEYLRQMEYLEDLREICLYEERFGVSGEDAERIVGQYWGWASPLYQKAEALFCQREMSMIPHSFYLDVLWPDMMDMARLLAICCFLLIVPWQVHERLRGVAPLCASTRVGRGIFGRRLWAALVSCGLMCIVQLLVYLVAFVSRGYWAFWRCPGWSDSVNEFWLPFSMGLYMLVYMLMVWLFAMGCAVLAYCISRWASNYVAGVALSIPAAGAACYLGTRLFHNLFCFYLAVRVPLWEVLVLVAWLGAGAGLAAFVLGRDRRREL